MLRSTRERIEEALHLAMLKYARENDGADGWRKTDLEKEITDAGGEEVDLLHAMELGLDLCGSGEVKRFHLREGGDGREAISIARDIERSLSVIAADAEAISSIVRDMVGREPEEVPAYIYAIHALAKELMEHECFAEEDMVEIKRQLRKRTS